MINAVSQVFMRCRTTDEPELLHQPDPALFCPICSRILEIPIRTNCGHTSCAECLRWHMTTSPDCPVCRAPIDSCSPQPDRLAEKIVGALECFCPERNEGCPWIGTRAGLAAHAKECRASRVRHTRADNSQYGKVHEPEPELYGRRTPEPFDCPWGCGEIIEGGTTGLERHRDVCSREPRRLMATIRQLQQQNQQLTSENRELETSRIWVRPSPAGPGACIE